MLFTLIKLHAPVDDIIVFIKLIGVAEQTKH